MTKDLSTIINELAAVESIENSLPLFFMDPALTSVCLDVCDQLPTQYSRVLVTGPDVKSSYKPWLCVTENDKNYGWTPNFNDPPCLHGLIPLFHHIRKMIELHEGNPWQGDSDTVLTIALVRYSEVISAWSTTTSHAWRLT
jgi:hypothetical protein